MGLGVQEGKEELVAPRKPKGTEEPSPAVPVGYPVKAYDGQGNEILPQEVRFVLTGGQIDFGGNPVPHPGRRVQGAFKGQIKGGGIELVQSRWTLILKVAVEDATVVELPEDEQVSKPPTKGQRRLGDNVAHLPEAHAYIRSAGADEDPDAECAVEGCGRPASHPIHTDTGVDPIGELGKQAKGE
jgi:hypothetical protein